MASFKLVKTDLEDSFVDRFAERVRRDCRPCDCEASSDIRIIDGGDGSYRSCNSKSTTNYIKRRRSGTLDVQIATKFAGLAIGLTSSDQPIFVHNVLGSVYVLLIDARNIVPFSVNTHGKELFMGSSNPTGLFIPKTIVIDGSAVSWHLY